MIGYPSASSEAIVRDLLDGTHDDGLEAAQVDAIWAGLGPVVGGGGQHGPAGATAASTYGAKALVLLLACGSVGAAAFAVARLTASRAAPVTVAAVATVADTLTSLTPAAVEPSASVPERWAPVPSVSAAAGEDANQAPQVPPGVGRAKVRAASDVARRPAPHAAPTSVSKEERAPESEAPAPARVSPPPAPPSAPAAIAEAAVTTPAPAPASSDAAPNEAALLLKARQRLLTQPAETLAMTQQAARLFPNGAFAEEREVLAIEALVRLGRSAEARRELDSFGQRFPSSLHVARLTALVGK